MFRKNKSQFKTEAELQAYIDKKINSTITSLTKTHATVVTNVRNSYDKKINKLEEKIVHLEKFLGIEFGTESITGYKKVKKGKK